MITLDSILMFLFGFILSPVMLAGMLSTAITAWVTILSVEKRDYIVALGSALMCIAFAGGFVLSVQALLMFLEQIKVT